MVYNDQPSPGLKYPGEFVQHVGVPDERGGEGGQDGVECVPGERQGGCGTANDGGVEAGPAELAAGDGGHVGRQVDAAGVETLPAQSHEHVARAEGDLQDARPGEERQAGSLPVFPLPQRHGPTDEVVAPGHFVVEEPEPGSEQPMVQVAQ